MNTSRLIVLVVIAIPLCLIIVTTAVIFAATAGGVGAAIAPDPSFKLVEWLVCPADTSIEYTEGGQVRYLDDDGSYSTGTTISVSCVGDPDSPQAGEVYEDRAAAAVLSLFSLYCLACFLPLACLSIPVLLFVVKKLPGPLAKRLDNLTTTTESESTAPFDDFPHDMH